MNGSVTLKLQATALPSIEWQPTCSKEEASREGKQVDRDQDRDQYPLSQSRTRLAKTALVATGSASAALARRTRGTTRPVSPVPLRLAQQVSAARPTRLAKTALVATGSASAVLARHTRGTTRPVSPVLLRLAQQVSAARPTRLAQRAVSRATLNSFMTQHKTAQLAPVASAPPEIAALPRQHAAFP
jgi:hypothetical protein